MCPFSNIISRIYEYFIILGNSVLYPYFIVILISIRIYWKL